MKEKKRKKIYKYSIRQLIIVVIIFINTAFFASIFGRYVVNNIKNFYNRTKEFYFYSDKLASNNPTYQIDNWSGVDDYIITINMNSYKNNLRSTSYDIEYDIEYTVSDNAICQLSKTKGTIYATTNTDYFTLTVTPNAVLDTGDAVYINIIASASSPYEQVIRGVFILKVGQEKLTYEITDSEDNPYLELDITNTLSYYIVDEAFENFSVGDKITREVYLEQTKENQGKCHSKIITITFDPNIILLDMTNISYREAISTTNTTINSNTYINGLTFKIDALSSHNIRFYKVDESKNYTYPNSNGTQSVITLSST